MPPRKRNEKAAGGPATLQHVANRLGLSPATVSLVVNHAPSAAAIPAATQERILAAARELDYRPNVFARSLRKQRSFTIGVLVPEISEGYSATVLSGIEDHLLQEGYFYFVASHRHRPDLIDEYPRMLRARAVEGIVVVDTALTRSLDLPTVAVSGHTLVEGVTNIVLNHRRAAVLALEHLYGLGHRRIAFIKGQEFSSDTSVRWQAISSAAAKIGIKIDPALTAQLEGDLPTPQPGYFAAQQLLANRAPFTAIFCFNDVSAIGAIRALRDAGLKVPQDVSIIGFDDIQAAAFQNPGLTTVRQPLRKMGALAAQCVLQRIQAAADGGSSRMVIEPELVVRNSTAPPREAEAKSRTVR
ncbi:MAG: LacI family DNA-binding transcriptional regulator [Terriglobales bacterium]